VQPLPHVRLHWFLEAQLYVTLLGGTTVPVGPPVVPPSIVVPVGPKEQVAMLAQVQVLPAHEQFPVQVTSETAGLSEPQSKAPAKTNGRSA
jgi:hypothetical protein